MGDAELIRQINFRRPMALAMLRRMPDGVLTIRSRFIITAAWGPRRTSARTRGRELSAYPPYVTAAKGLWETWLSLPRDHVQIVIAKKLAQARIDAALRNSGLARDPETIEQEPAGKITEAEIADILAEREELRAARDFARADMLRDYLVGHGVSVADQKVRTP